MDKLVAAEVGIASGEKSYVGTVAFPAAVGVSGGVEEFWVMIEIASEEQYVSLSAFVREVGVRLKEKLGAGVATLLDLEKAVNEVASGFTGVKLTIVVVGREGRRVLMAGWGGGMVGLWRDGVLGRILDVSTGNNKVMGELQESDLLLVGTKEFFERMTPAELGEVLEGGESDSASEGAVERKVKTVVEAVAGELATRVERLENKEGVAVLVVGLGREEEELGEGQMLDAATTPTLRGAGKYQNEKISWREKWQQWRESLTGRMEGRKIFVRGVGGREERELRRRRAGVLVFAVMAVVLLASVGLGWRKRQADKLNALAAEFVEPAQRLYEQALVEEGIDKLRARALMGEAKSKLVEGKERLTEGSKQRQEVEELLTKIEGDYQRVSGEQRVEPRVWFDLGLVKADFLGEKAALAGEELVVMDGGKAAVVAVGLANKNAREVAGGEDLAGSKLIAGVEKAGMVLADKGVVRLNLEEKKTEVVVEKDDEWKEVVGLGAFGSNVYVLDKALGEIWKYSVSSGKAVRSRWLAPGVTPDFSDVVDMAIDGDIWVLDKAGGVRQYSRGASTGFSLMGLGREITEAAAVAADERGVYILDRGAKAVVMFDRSGNYQKQWLWEGIATAADMVVVQKTDTDNGRILLLAGGVVYEIGQ